MQTYNIDRYERIILRMENSNKKNNLLILGGSSLLSFLWCKAIDKNYNIFLTQHLKDISHMGFECILINSLSCESLVNTLKQYSINYVVNTIGLTSVEECQADPKKAYYLNASLPGIIAKACFITDTKLIHISTDHFFNDEDRKHTEKDDVSLLNIYSKSKYEGEIQVLSNLSSALVCRTNFFGYGPEHKLSFSDWIIKSCKNREKINLFNDVFITPVSGYNLASISHELLDLKCEGIYNISADEKISKFEFGILLCKNLKLSTAFINSGSIFDRKDLIKRPNSMALSNMKASKKLNKKIGDPEIQIKSI